jgi:hypothetical protein
MQAETIVAQLRARGISLSLDGGSIVVRPRQKLTDSDRQLIREHKAELLTLVNAQIAERFVMLDRERFERDRSIGRGYDVARAQPAEPEPPRRDEMDPDVRAEISRIESEALGLGWPAERLWARLFWPVEERGLASVLEPGDRIAEVTREFVLIEKSDSRRARVRFWRTDG